MTGCDRLRSACAMMCGGRTDPISVPFYIIFTKRAGAELYLIRILHKRGGGCAPRGIDASKAAMKSADTQRKRYCAL